MTDIWPSIRTIIAIFYFAFWFYKGVTPFSIWWLILSYIVDYAVSIVLLSLTSAITTKAIEKQHESFRRP